MPAMINFHQSIFKLRYFTKQPGLVEQQHVGGFIAPTPRPPSPETTLPNQIAAADPNEVQMEDSPQQEPILMQENQIIPSQEPLTNINQEELTRDIEVSGKENDSDLAHSQTQNQDKAIEMEAETDTQPIDVDVEEPVHFLNEHGVLVYLPPNDSTSLSKQIQEESDDFFEHTEEEIRKMMNELISKNNQLQTAPLMTAQLRREQEEQRRLQFLAKYPTTVLRIQFNDRFVLQLPSPSGSTLAEVKQQLVQYLEIERTTESFEIFTTPPKQVLGTSLPLHQLGLTPSSHVYVSSNCVLKEQYRLNPSSYAGAVRDASFRLYRTNTNLIKDEQRQKRPASDSSSSNSSSEKNLPKWLKLKR